VPILLASISTLPRAPAGDVDAGVIEDARARQRRHRAAAVFVLAVIAVAGLLIGASGGAHGGGSGGYASGRPSGSSSSANIGHASNAPAAVAACNWLIRPNGPPTLTGKPVLEDGLGRYTATIYVDGRVARTCASNGQHTATSVTTNNIPLGFEPALGPDQLGSPSGGGSHAPGFAGSSQEENVQGRAGSAISAVEFEFKNRSAVKATVQNGWYFAWWPRDTWPTTVTTTAGTTRITSPMDVTACQAKPSGCVFAEPNSTNR
jgi:hypothetical protein